MAEYNPIKEVISFLEHLRDRARDCGTLTEGNVIVNVAHLDNAIIAAHKILAGEHESRKDESVERLSETVEKTHSTPEELISRVPDPVSKKKRF
jgi:hypothetical protein